MFANGVFNPPSIGFPFVGQNPKPTIYQSQFTGFNGQGSLPFQQASARGQSLPASARQYPPINGPYMPAPPQPPGQYPSMPPPLPASSQRYEHRKNHGSRNKKPPKRSSVSPSNAVDHGLYSDKEHCETTEQPPKENKVSDQNQTSGSESTIKQEETNNQSQKSQTIDNVADETSQRDALAGDEEQHSNQNKDRKSRPKKKKHHRHEHHEMFNSQFPPSNVFRGQYNNELPPPHMNIQQQAFNRMQRPFNPYPSQYASQTGFFTPPVPYKTVQPWQKVGIANGQAEHEIQRLRSHVHSLEGQLHKLKKKLNKTTLNNNETSIIEENQRSKLPNTASPQHTPSIVELNSTSNDTEQKLSSKHKHNEKINQANVQQEQNTNQNINGISTEPKLGHNGVPSINQTLNQNQINSSEHTNEHEVKPAVLKSAREETAAQLAHAAAAYVNSRQQIPAPPPVQQNSNYHNPQQQHQISNSNYNQSNNNDIYENNDKRRNRSVEKILDAFERFYMHSGKSSTAPMKVKYIPEDHNGHQRV